ncbi:MAG: RtcB family protein [Planctomycetes bacterium]|jgi:tRNA-splicing ligase RtcB|nr:RtcB family protein [Planctomycetota bacterium]
MSNISLKRISLKRIDTCLYEIPKHDKMRVPGRIYANANTLNDLYEDECLQQVINVAHLPGIVGYSLAMPDIHWGYGFPIGGVAAMDFEEGVITPGGIGFDINCGVRLIRTDLQLEQIQPHIHDIVNQLFSNIPSGLGSKNRLRLNANELCQILSKGAAWTVSQGYTDKETLEYIESKGTMPNADPDVISSRAMERGLNQIATLGSGNHFLEIDIIDEIYDQKIANVLQLSKNQIMFQVHTGSRGLGYQICEDYIKKMTKAMKKYNIEVPDKQLCCAPIQSPEGQEYLSAMACAANFAFVNRQMIQYYIQETMLHALGFTPNELNMTLIYDICHNIGQIEEHIFQGVQRKVLIHRKGATRAFGPHHPTLPNSYKTIGQPVLIPGDMGRYSFLLVGTQKAMEETFGSACHGAGRKLSRGQALKQFKSRNLRQEFKEKGIVVRDGSKDGKGLYEEISEAYKDVEDVVDIMQDSGICKKVVRLRPIGVIKG